MLKVQAVGSGRLRAVMNRTVTVPALRGLMTWQERQKFKQVIATSPLKGSAVS